MAASALGLLGRSATVLAASTRSTLGRATLATGQTEGQKISWQDLQFKPISQIPGSPAPELPEISPEDLAYLTGAALPELSKKPVDEADAFACKIGQRLLYGWWDYLRPDVPRLRERPGVEINATSFLLPLPEHIKPDAKLAASLAKQKKGRKEFRRQEQLNAGRLGTRFGETETWKKIKQRLAQGYTLEQSLILHYYERYGAPKTIEERRVTLADIFNRATSLDWLLDEDMYDTQFYHAQVTEEDLAGLTPERREGLLKATSLLTKYPTYEEYMKTYKEAEARQSLPKLPEKIPTWAEIEKMPEAERIQHTHARTEYDKLFETPLRMTDKFFALLDTAPAFMRKIVHAHMKKAVAATEARKKANDNDPRFPRTGAAAQRAPVDPDLVAKYQTYWQRLSNPEKFDDYKDNPDKITNPDLKRLIE